MTLPGWDYRPSPNAGRLVPLVRHAAGNGINDLISYYLLLNPGFYRWLVGAE